MLPPFRAKILAHTGLKGRFTAENPFHSACRNATGQRCYVISRSTYPGAGKFTGHWLGDNTSKWPHLKASIIGVMEFNLFGFPYVSNFALISFNTFLRKVLKLTPILFQFCVVSPKSDAKCQ